jgi:hypothetical protein
MSTKNATNCTKWLEYSQFIVKYLSFPKSLIKWLEGVLAEYLKHVNID